MRILSLDGGGIRGVLEARFLARLERDIEGTIFDKFDLIAGTSTGGLLALLIAANRASGADCLELYSPQNAQTIMDKSFYDRLLPAQSSPKYDGKGKRKILKQIFNKRRIHDITDKKVLLTAYDIINRRGVVFKSFGGADSANNPTLVEIADATSAAPTYFPTVKTGDTPHRWLIDGGLAANDPSMCALVEALKSGTDLNDIAMLSIGTGIPTREKHSADELGKKSQTWGGIGWLQNGLIDHLFAGNSSLNRFHCQQLLAERYLRIDGELIGADDDLDNVEKSNIDNLVALADKWYEEHGRKAVELLN